MRSAPVIAETIAVALPNASQHLAILRGAGLVEGRRIGTTVRYRLAEPAIVEACDVIDAIVGRRLASPWTSSPASSPASRPASRAASLADPVSPAIQR
jgi:DNA-binding IscR family transcriptional regulator